MSELTHAGAAGDDAARFATVLSTSRDWSALAVSPALVHDLRDLAAEAQRDADAAGSDGARGVTALFDGPRGAGKTSAARVVAGELGRPLYRFDLAALASAYLVETEKQLGAVFSAAESADAVLLLDEADALFGRRTDVRGAHDRYADLDVAYLLDRLDDYGGVAIVATRCAADLDDALLRRLRRAVRFPARGGSSGPDDAVRRSVEP